MSKVECSGCKEEKIYIEFSVGDISNLGVDANDVIRAIQAPNLVIPAGLITTENERIIIRMSGAYRSEDDVRRINLHTRRLYSARRHRNCNAGAMRPSDPDVPVRRKAGDWSRSIDGVGRRHSRLGKAVRREVADIQAQPAHRVGPPPCCRSSRGRHQGGTGFTKALFEAIAIVLAVGFLALGLRAGLVVAVAIPLVLAATFTIMS